MITFLKTYILTFFIFLGVDLIWLVKVAPNFYKKYIGHLMANKPNLLPAGIFYLVYMLGLTVFAIIPARNKQEWQVAILNGALFGLCTYSTYDLTNHATLKNWPTIVTIVDIIWGTVLSAIVAFLSYRISNKIF